MTEVRKYVCDLKNITLAKIPGTFGMELNRILKYLGTLHSFYDDTHNQPGLLSPAIYLGATSKTSLPRVREYVSISASEFIFVLSLDYLSKTAMTLCSK